MFQHFDLDHTIMSSVPLPPWPDPWSTYPHEEDDEGASDELLLSEALNQVRPAGFPQAYPSMVDPPLLGTDLSQPVLGEDTIDPRLLVLDTAQQHPYHGGWREATIPSEPIAVNNSVHPSSDPSFPA
jgi:hypothetical protein